MWTCAVRWLRLGRWVLGVGILCWSPALAGAQGVAGDQKIARAIVELGDPNLQVRQAAQQALWSAGRAAEPALIEAAQGNDPEAAARAGQILADFRCGIYPDTPAEILVLLRSYRGGQAVEKQAAVEGLLRIGPKAYPYLARLSANEQDAALRQRIFLELARRAGEVAPALLAQGDLAATEQLLELALAEGSSGGARTYAAYLLRRGAIDAKIAELRKQLDAPNPPAQPARVLSYLYRAKGNLAEARWAAQRSGNAELLENILVEQGDWKAFAQQLDNRIGGSREMEELGFLAAAHRLAGNTDRREQVLASLGLVNQGVPQQQWYLATALLLNDHPQEGIDLLRKADRAGEVFDLLVAQHRFAEAIEAAEKAIAAQHAHRLALQAGLGRLLYFLGEKERGQKVLDELAAELEKSGDRQGYVRLIIAERQCRLEERALAHCQAALAKTSPADSVGDYLRATFGGRAEEAEAWFRFLRQRSGQDEPKEAFQSLRGVLEGTLNGEQLDAMAREAYRSQPGPALLIMARTLLAANRPQAAQDLLEKLLQLPRQTHGVAQLRGQIAFKQKQWAEAAAWFARAIEQDATDAASIYLRGHALLQAGNENEGKRLMEQALLLPLADETRRMALIEALEQAGLEEASRQEQVFLLRTGEFLDPELGGALHRAADEARSRGEHLLAADLWERATLPCLQLGARFVESSAYVNLPHLAHRLRARGLLEAGKTIPALAEAQVGQAYIPGDVDVPIELMPALVKAGRQDEAEALFNEALAFHEKLLEAYPNCASEHNAIAWLLARCRRDLDRALAEAQKAVDLEPQSTAILDTLAEVHFQRNEKEKAIAAMQKCIELEPQASRHKAAIKRFEESTPETPPPPE